MGGGEINDVATLRSFESRGYSSRCRPNFPIVRHLRAARCDPPGYLSPLIPPLPVRPPARPPAHLPYPCCREAATMRGAIDRGYDFSPRICETREQPSTPTPARGTL